MEQDSKFQANTSLENNSQGKVPFISKLAYGMGDVGCNFSWMFVGNFLMIFYTPSSAHLPIRPTPDGDDSVHGCSSELLSRHWY